MNACRRDLNALEIRMATTTSPSKSLIRLMLVGAAAASLAACASKPKPLPPVPEAPRAPPTAPRAPEPPRQQPRAPEAPPAPQQQGALPGSAQDFVVSAGDRVYFDFDSYTVRDDAKPVLNAQAIWLARYPNVTVRIDGNADERGTVDYNFALGARRANSVKDYLASKGVASSRIETVSYGKSKPVDERSSEEGWAANRNGHTAITGGAR
jgi:peptidoglycan-associated lipoprotein